MVGIADFMGGDGVAWGVPLPLLALLLSRLAIEVVTSPARDHTLSKSCVVRGLGVLRGSTSFYLPPGVRLLTLPTRLIEFITRLFLSNTRPLSRVVP